MDSKTVDYLSKLAFEDDEEDLIKFTFLNEKRKIKCYKSMLSKVSPVFRTMFSENWNQQKSSIEINDVAAFDQYSTFKLFMEVLYGLRQVDSLNVDEATAVYFYSDKYQVKDVGDKIQKFLNQRMESGMSKEPFSVTELQNGLEFAQIYQLDDFKEKLDQVKLDFNDENPIVFFDLANKFKMEMLKEQVVQYLKTIEPKDDFRPDVLRSVLQCLQKERKEIKEKLDETFDAQRICTACLAPRKYVLYCSSCRLKSNAPVNIPKL